MCTHGPRTVARWLLGGSDSSNRIEAGSEEEKKQDALGCSRKTSESSLAPSAGHYEKVRTVAGRLLSD